MHFFQIVLKNVLRRKVRSLLTSVGVAAAVATVVALIGFTTGFQHSSTELYHARGVDLVVVRAGVTQRLTSNLSEGFAVRLAAMPGVRGVSPSLTDLVSFGEGSLVGIPVRGWKPGSFAFESLGIASGRMLHPDDRHKVMLGSMLAETIQKKVGDRVHIELADFEIIGIFQGPNTIDSATAVVRLEDLQRLMDRSGQVTEFQLKLEPGLAEDLDALKRFRSQIADLRDEHGKRLGLQGIPTREYVNTSIEMRLSRAMAWATSAIALAIGTISMLNTMFMSVFERTQEIGILRAIGWRPWRIMRMILSESLMLSLAGTAVGLALAVAITSVVSRLPLAQGMVRPHLSLGVVGLGALLGPIVAVVGGLYPAYRGMRLAPTEALRYE